MNRLVLGTAQLGMPYGIANRTGQPDQDLANDILSAAWEGGVRMLDTAQAYGESEIVIGRFLKSHPQRRFDIITKLAPDVDITSSADIAAAVTESTERLGQKPAALFLHSYNQLAQWSGALGKTLIDLKHQGEISSLGISVYGPDEFRKAIEQPEIAWIQAPLNVFDQRLIEQNLLEEAGKNGKRVFLRSVFLQGLLLMTHNALPPAMAFASTAIQEWQSLCRRHGLSPHKAALVFALSSAPDAWVVIGCETKAQIEKNLKVIGQILPNEEFIAEAHTLGANNPELINPSTWPKHMAVN